MATRNQRAGTPETGACGSFPVAHGDFIRQVLDRVGDRWTLLVIANLSDGPRRYSDLERVVPGIPQRMLTLTLRQLAADGFITRAAYAEMPPRVEYSLTPLGESFVEMAGTVIRWAAAHRSEILAHRTRVPGSGGSVVGAAGFEPATPRL